MTRRTLTIAATIALALALALVATVLITQATQRADTYRTSFDRTMQGELER